jgi:long-chain fatty acid transport protein
MVLCHDMPAQRGGLRVLACVVLVSALATTPAPARAGGFAVPEVGVRRTGMGAVVGRPDEPSCIYHNPAGLTLLEGTRLYVNFGVGLLQSKMYLRPWAGSDRFITQPVDSSGYYPGASPKVAIGIIPMLVATTNLLRDRVYGALSFNVPNGTGSILPKDGVTRYHLTMGYLITGLWSGTLGWRIADWLSVGAGVGVMYVRLYGKRYLFPILNGQDESALLGSNSELTLSGSDTVPNWTAGLLLRPQKEVSFGLTVISRSDATLKGPVKIDINEYNLHIDGSHRTGMVVPWTLLTGANVDIHPKVEIGVEYRYYFYSAYKRSHSDLQGLEPFLTELDTPKNYTNSWQIAGGVRVHSLPRVPNLELMAGGHYDRTPAPGNTVSLDQPTFSHYGFRLGARYTLREKYRFGFSYTRYWYLIPTVEDSLTTPPSNYKGSGGNNILTVSFEAVLGRGLGEMLARKRPAPPPAASPPATAPASTPAPTQPAT